MKLRLTAALAGLVAGTLASSAMAEPVVAKLQAPTQGAAKPVAGGAVFECLGEVCAARAPASDTAGPRGCKDLVRQVGAVTSFGLASKQLSADQLTECNSSARK